MDGKQNTINTKFNITMKYSEIRQRYTRVVKIGERWNCYLKIDHQEFRVVEQATYRHAQRYGKMLSQALERMIKYNKFRDSIG